VRHFTDPACPFAYSAEPARLRLRWLFGDQLSWTQVMVVLSEDVEDITRRGFTPQMLAGGLAGIAERYGMPIATGVRPRLATSVDACRAVVAARLHQPDREEALLRRLRRAAMGGDLIDERDVINRCATEAGIDPEALNEWLTEEAVETQMRSDMSAARNPMPASLALDHKLAAAGTGRRYTCPSYEFTSTATAPTLSTPGFQSVDVYEVLLANVAPDLTRRPAPESAEEVLHWAGEPLATAEVAAVMGVDREEAFEKLTECAEPTEFGTDYFWAATPR
jgi:predicted DsbA family dithiol-disulfide isomerase